MVRRAEKLGPREILVMGVGIERGVGLLDSAVSPILIWKNVMDQCPVRTVKQTVNE